MDVFEPGVDSTNKQTTFSFFFFLFFATLRRVTAFQKCAVHTLHVIHAN